MHDFGVLLVILAGLGVILSVFRILVPIKVVGLATRKRAVFVLVVSLVVFPIGNALTGDQYSGPPTSSSALHAPPNRVAPAQPKEPQLGTPSTSPTRLDTSRANLAPPREPKEAVEKALSSDDAVDAELSVPIALDGAPAGGTGIHGGNLAFLYEARAEQPASLHELAEIMSPEYRLAQDEFTRRDALEAAKTAIESQLAAARHVEAVYFSFEEDLGEYDFDQMSFDTGIKANQAYRIDYGYHYSASRRPGREYRVVIANGGKLARLPVPLEAARKLASSLATSRRCVFKIHGTLHAVKRGKPVPNPEIKSRKYLYVNATRFEATLVSGAFVGDKDL